MSGQKIIDGLKEALEYAGRAPQDELGLGERLRNLAAGCRALGNKHVRFAPEEVDAIAAALTILIAERDGLAKEVEGFVSSRLRMKDRYRKAAIAARDRAEAAKVRANSEGDGEWQPIETAPKDGERFLVYSERNQRHDILFWRVTDDEYEDHFESALGYGGIPVPFLTRWCPIPASIPATGGEKV